MGWQRTHSKSACRSFHDLVCRLAEWPLVYGLFLLSVISSAAGDSTASTVAATSDDDVQQQEKASSSLDPAILVVSITFPVGILVGVLWCYCMTALLKIRTRNQGKKPSVNGMAEHNQRHYHEHHHHDHQHYQHHHRERSPSPLSSSASSSPCGSRSPSPLALPPDIP